MLLDQNFHVNQRLIIYILDFMLYYFSLAKIFIVEGMFRSCSGSFYPFYTINFVINNKTITAISSFSPEKKTENIYNEFLKKIRTNTI